MARLTHDEYYLGLLKSAAQLSTCARRQVAAILVDSRNVVLSVGYNGVPRGWVHCTDTPCAGVSGEKGDTRDCYAVHAEVNAVLQCTDLTRISTLYVSCTPCFECAKMLANLKLRRIVCAEVYADERGLQMLKDLGTEIVIAKV